MTIKRVKAYIDFAADETTTAAGKSKTDEKVKEALKEARRLSAALEESKALTEKLEGEVRESHSLLQQSNNLSTIGSRLSRLV